jgi:dihydrodipicolinate synthase/N-acetylneuraminate lyase
VSGSKVVVFVRMRGSFAMWAGIVPLKFLQSRSAFARSTFQQALAMQKTLFGFWNFLFDRGLVSLGDIFVLWPAVFSMN